jgi:hypothetical protein
MSSIMSITYDDAIPVTPSDSVSDVAGPFAGFYSGTGGTIVVQTVRSGNSVVRTLLGVPAGIIVPLAIVRVNATGTTATGIFGMVAMPYKGGRGP